MSENKTVRAIVVDDQELTRNDIAAELEGLGCEVVGEATNGRGCIELWEQERPDLVLLDLQMPEVSGEFAARYILQKDPDAYIVILTSKIDDDQKRRLLVDAGARAWLRKDLKTDELKAELKKHVDRISGAESGS